MVIHVAEGVFIQGEARLVAYYLNGARPQPPQIVWDSTYARTVWPSVTKLAQ